MVIPIQPSAIGTIVDRNGGLLIGGVELDNVKLARTPDLIRDFGGESDDGLAVAARIGNPPCILCICRQVKWLRLYHRLHDFVWLERIRRGGLCNRPLHALLRDDVNEGVRVPRRSHSYVNRVRAAGSAVADAALPARDRPLNVRVQLLMGRQKVVALVASGASIGAC